MCHKVTCKFLDVDEGGDFTHTRANLQMFWWGNTALLTLKSNLSMILYSVLSTLNEPSLVLQSFLTIQFLISCYHYFLRTLI